jgi:phospholipase/lecithinase/hemolysin
VAATAGIAFSAFYFHSSHPSTAVHKKVGDMLYSELISGNRMAEARN